MAAPSISVFTFTSDTVRIITLDSSVFPSCSVNDGGNISAVDFSQLYNYVTQSDGDFYIEDLTVTFDVVGYSSVRFYNRPQYFMPLSVLPYGYSYVNGVFTAPDIPSGGASVSISSSLNGNGCEFMDGVKVNVNGREQVYTVQYSFFFLIDDNTYTPLYSLKSDSGSTLYAPETLCTLYVEPVTTP